jgi:hypothetical protein
MAITKRYIHPQAETVRAATERAREVQGGHRIGHSAENESPADLKAVAVIN